jgi:hypothetical protein
MSKISQPVVENSCEKEVTGRNFAGRKKIHRQFIAAFEIMKNHKLDLQKVSFQPLLRHYHPYDMNHENGKLLVENI